MLNSKNITFSMQICKWIFKFVIDWHSVTHFDCLYHFFQGDIIDLVRKIDDNWWDAKSGTKKGIVPASYVDVIREPSGKSNKSLNINGLHH